MGRKIQEIAIFALCVVILASPSFAQKKKERDTAVKPKESELVRLIKAESIELLEQDGHPCRRTVKATFKHNGMTLICDTALWNLDLKYIDAWGHVKMTQGDVTLTSERLEYDIEQSLAMFRGDVVQLKDKKNNTLRTADLDYNTADSLATFRNGGAMRSAEGQVMESVNGSYDMREKLFTFRSDVNMFSDSVFVRTQDLQYRTEIKTAFFEDPVDFWKDENMLSAKWGWYDKGKELFYFEKSVHAMTDAQEGWCDSMYFYRNEKKALLLGQAQVQDTSRNAIAVAGRILYEGNEHRVTLTEDAAIASETEHDDVVDTVYFGADKFVYYTLRKCDVPENEFTEAKTRLEDMMADPIAVYRKKAAEEAAAAAATEAERLQLNSKRPSANPTKLDAASSRRHPELVSGPPVSGPPADSTRHPELVSGPPVSGPPADSLSLADSTSRRHPELVSGPPADSTLRRHPELVSGPPADSLSTPVDTVSRIGFLIALGDVRSFREDMQMRCDSLLYSEIDSVGRFYIDPVIWNEGTRQYSADSLYALVKDGVMDRVSLLSNAMVISQQDTMYYDQIKGTEMMAYFNRKSQLRRFDALGGASAIFFIEENKGLSSVNKVDSKMMTAVLKDGEIDRVTYFDKTKNDAFPLEGYSEEELYLKGFAWDAERRPMRREDVTTLRVRRSQRKFYSSKTRASFPLTEVYFPGYMDGVYKEIEENKARKAASDSLSRHPELVSGPLVSGPPADSLFPADSTLRRHPELVSGPLADSTSRRHPELVSGPLADSTSRRHPELVSGPPADSTALADTAATSAPLTKAQQRQAELDAKLKAREEARNAKWDEMDRREAAKKEARLERKLARKREKTRKLLIQKQIQDRKDAIKLQQYIDKFKRKKAHGKHS